MRTEYFLVKILFDNEGNPILPSEEMIAYIDDKRMITDIEHNHEINKLIGKGTKDDYLDEASGASKRRSVRPTRPMIPKVI